jgi:cell division septal protein FtsQ
MKKHPKARQISAKLVLVAFVFLGLYAFGVYLKRVTTRIEYFRVKEIISIEPAKDTFSYLEGRNIFALDLKKESRYIAALYPAYKKVRLIRILPNQLFVDFVKRTPVAYVRLYRYFYVDDELMLLEPVQQPTEPELPVITGLETKIFGPKTGKRYTIPELAFAVYVLQKAKAHSVLRGYPIQMLDVKSLGNVSCFIPFLTIASENAKKKTTQVEAVMEIKVSPDNIRQKLDILGSLLQQLKQNAGNIQYVDLRFKEPVIKFRDVK